MADISTRLASDRDLEVLRNIYPTRVAEQRRRPRQMCSPHRPRCAGAGPGLRLGGRAWRRTDTAGSWASRPSSTSRGGLELEDLFVDPDAMRQGVASRLVLDATVQAARDGVAWIEVIANHHAAQFYASAGFVPVGDEQTLFGPAHRLRRDIVSPD